MADYQRPNPMFRFACRGMSLKPIDQLQPDEYGYLQNVRVIAPGRIDSRLGADRATPTNFGAPVHSVRRLIDKVVGFSRWVVGAGTTVTVDGGVGSPDSGYSGDPLSLVVWRPDQSVSPFMYVGDRSKMSKTKIDGVFKSWGLPQPIVPPVQAQTVSSNTAPGRQTLQIIPENSGIAGAFTASGTAGAPTSGLRVPVTQIAQQAIPYPLAQTTPGGPGMWCAALTSGAIAGGAVTSILLTSGGGGFFIGAFVSITGGGGSGATATCTFSGGVITSVTLTNGGSGYTTPPAVTITGDGHGAFATAFISTSGSPGIPSYTQGYPGILPGSLLNINQGASSPGTHFCDATVEQVLIGAPDTTIAGIQYDTGTTGQCTLVPAALAAQAAGDSSSFANPDMALKVDAVAPGTIVVLNYGGGSQEFAVVEAVLNGPNGSACLRINLANTHAVGEAISFVPTIVFSANGFSNPGSGSSFVTATYVRSAVTAGEGTIKSLFGVRLVPTSPNTYQWKQEDYAHIMLRMDHPENVTAITVYFDVDAAGNNDLAHNAYYYVISSNVLIDPSTQGQAQWQDYGWRLSDMQRIGTDDSSSLQTIYAVGIVVDAVGPVNVDFDSICMIGGGAIDVGSSAIDYYYRFRWRDLDGSYSNWSPPTRAGLHLQRSAAIITVPGAGTPYDKADIARFGGALTAWTYVGTTDALQSWQFLDNYSDEAVAALPQAELDDFQPFPDIDVPHAGVCNVNGDIVTWVSGDQFSTSWAAGSEILVNETVYHLYTSPDSATKLRIVENAGAQTGVNFQLPEPTLLAQPLPTVWGPDDQGTMFAAGSKYQPGVVFFTNPNSPDNASDKNQIELGSPGDPIMGGVLNAGRAIACSNTKWWALYPQLNQPAKYQPVELQVGKPLLCRTGICTDGQTIAFLSDDGIYITTGAQAQSITDPDLRDLFPHQTQATVTVPTGPIYGPDFTKPNSMRLAIADRLIYFDYLDTNGSQNTLIYDLRTGGWVSHDVFPFSPIMHYGVEEGLGDGLTFGFVKVIIGCVDGLMRWYNSPGDETTPSTFVKINGKVYTGAFDAGDFRADKKWGDMVVDYECPAATTGIVVAPYYNNFTIAGPTDTLPPSTRTLSFPFDLSQQESRNLGIYYSWTEFAPLILYGWQPSYIVQPVNMGTTPTDWDDDGYIGAKWLQGCIIESDTGNVPRTIQVQGDGGVVGATITAQTSGQGVQAFSWPPFITHLMRLAPTDAGDEWKNYKVQWVWEPEPELAAFWVTQGTDHDLQGFMHVKEVQIAHISTADITLQIGADGATITRTVPNSGGTYRKTYLILPPNKAKIYSYSLTSSPGFRLFKKDCEVRVKQWGSTGPYLPFNPFGGPHRADGARI